ncbi:MAG: hypothetical protein ACQETI_05550, partial [Halobacteriota archaeon]
LVNTAGLLQETAEQTGEESQAQVTDRIQAISSYAEDTTASDGANFDTMNLVIKRSSGSSDINVTRVTVNWLGPGGPEQYTVATGDVNNVVGTDNDILQANSDRVRLSFELGTDFGSAMSPGDEFTMELTTESGATTIIKGTVPNTAQDGDTVEL